MPRALSRFAGLLNKLLGLVPKAAAPATITRKPMGLLDQAHSFAQGASKGFWAGNLGAPVDMATLAVNGLIAGGGYAGHKLGLLDTPPSLIEKPVGGSEWIADKMRGVGLLKDNPGSTADTYGQVAGGLLGPLIAAKSPQIANGLLRASANLSAPTALNPQAGKVLVGSRAEKMAAMDMEPGWFRGGAKINDGRRSGPWYTQDADEAANYAKRFGADADLREYAIPKSGFLNANSGYSHKLPNDVARILDDPYFGAPGASLAKELRTFGPGEGVTGGQLWQALESRFGNDGAADVLQRLGSFKGAKGMTGGPEAYVFKGAPVRDANKAAFDLSKYAVDDIYGKTTLPMLGAVGGTALGAGYLLHKE